MSTNDEKTYTIDDICELVEQIAKLTKDRDEARELAETWRACASWRDEPQPEPTDFPWETATDRDR